MDQINALMADMPGWLAAIILLVVAIVLAFIVKTVVSTLINKTRFGAKAKTTGGNLGNALGTAGFWLTLLFFVPPILGALDMAEYGRPIDDLFRNIADFLPRLLGAALVFGIGYIVAKIAQNAVTATLRAMNIDGIASRFGIGDATTTVDPVTGTATTTAAPAASTGSLARGLGTLLFILIIVPVVIGALGILEIDGISEPLSGMLQSFVDFIPNLVSAAVVLGLALFIGRFVSNFIKGFLPTLGFDNSVNTLMAIDDGQGLRFQPSAVAGNLAFLIIAVLGLTAALDILGVEFLSATFDEIVAFGGQLLRAAVLIMIGVFLANFISRIMAGMISPKIAEFFRYVAILIFVFLGLSSLDPAGQIIPTAFGALVIGASVAGSIAFGFGGRDWAGQVLNKMFPPKSIDGPAAKPAARKAPARKAPVRRKTPPKI